MRPRQSADICPFFDPVCLGGKETQRNNNPMKKISIGFLALALALSSPIFAAPKEALFVVMGGYTSCGKGTAEPAGIGMYEPFMRMLETMKQSEPRMKIHYLISCFGNSAPPHGKTKYILSTEPQRVLQGNASVLMNEIEKLVDGKDMAIFIAGHSYGGYLGMYLVEKLSLQAKVQGLYTVDPIGPACGKIQVVMGAKACKSPPADLHNGWIKDQSVLWKNFYQNQDKWLHSGPIEEAVNTHIVYRGAHTQIDSDERTWSEIGVSVMEVVKGK